MTDAHADTSTEIDKSLDPAGSLADALEEHASALVSIFDRLGDETEDVDLLKEGVECSLRLARTTGRFLWYWGNMAKLWLIDSDTPRWYPPPPVTAEGFTLPVELAVAGPVTASGGLRRRGEAAPTPQAAVEIGPFQNGLVTVTVKGKGIPRGMYEIKLTVTGTTQEILHNIYIDPTA